MQNVFNRFRFSHLRNAEHVQMVRAIIQLILSSTAAAAMLSNALFTKLLGGAAVWGWEGLRAAR